MQNVQANINTVNQLSKPLQIILAVLNAQTNCKLKKLLGRWHIPISNSWGGDKLVPRVALAMTVDALSASDLTLPVDVDRRSVFAGLDVWLVLRKSTPKKFVTRFKNAYLN